jgi:nucleoside-diphosphate-sugar epimerase
MRYLITGGAGFIGSHLAEHLLGFGASVTVIDDISTGSLDNIAHLRSRAGFDAVVASVEQESVLGDLVDRADVVFHLAAAVGVKLIIESPVRTIFTNVHGTEVVLKLAEKGKKRVIVTSTSEVYGKSNSCPFREDDDLILGPPTKGRWSYACSKAIDEFLAIAYWKESKLPVTIVRPFNTVGPRQTGRYGMVVPTFVRQALLGEPITVFGDGGQSRCFIHVQDSVWALAKLAVEPRAIGEIFNIGNPEEITIGGLAALVKEETGSDSPIVHVPYDQAYQKGFEDMPRRVPDISKVARLTGFEPKHGIRDIVRDVVRTTVVQPAERLPLRPSKLA